jgi:subtilisin family serine protease
VWPGARTVNLPTTLSCGDLVARIADAVRLGARVLNMSYGSARPCRAETLALQAATARGVLLVAAAGNGMAAGNPLEFPASLPHVLTVAAAAGRTEAASFSNANAAVDLAAPGVGVLTTVPPALDRDGSADGYALLSGTSFAAPIVAGAAGWLMAARPELDALQIQQVLRAGADDMDAVGWDMRTGWGLPRPRRRARPAGAAARPPRSRTTSWASSTAAWAGRRRPCSARAHGRPASTPRSTWPRTRATSTASSSRRAAACA